MAYRCRATMADLLDELRKDPEVIDLFVQFHPGIWDDLAAQGYCCLEFEQLPLAFQIFDFLLKYHPAEPAFWAGYADALVGMRKYNEAADAYRKTIELAPQIPDAHFCLAEICLFGRNHREAIPKLELVCALTASQPEHPLAEKSREYLSYACQNN